MKRIKHGAAQAASLGYRTQRFTCKRALLATALASGLGCSGTPSDSAAASGGATHELAEVDQALSSSVWKNWGRITDFPFGIDSTPAACGNVDAMFFIAARRASDKKFYLKTFDNYVWQTDAKVFDTKADGTKLSFASAPTCTMLAPYPGNSTSFLLAGKGSDNKIYVQLGTADHTRDFIATPPTPTVWAQLPNSGTFSTAGEGAPALASNGSRLALAYRAKDSIGRQRVYVHNRSLPIGAGSAWSAALAAPLLPDSAVATGTPAISRTGSGFLIVVRGLGGLYTIHFDGTQFTSSWVRVPVLPYSHTVDSDPSLEWDPLNSWLTVYFKSGDKILQSSGTTEAGWGWYLPVDPYGTHTFDSPPNATFGGGIEAGRRTLLAREGDHVLLVEDIGGLENDPNEPTEF